MAWHLCWLWHAGMLMHLKQEGVGWQPVGLQACIHSTIGWACCTLHIMVQPLVITMCHAPVGPQLEVPGVPSSGA